MARLGEAGVTDLVPSRGAPVAHFSDDTQMTIAVARALIAADVTSLDDVMHHVRREFLAWAKSPENDRAPGQACMDGVRQMERGVHWFASGDPYSKGCGAAMRVAPIGLLFARDLDMLIAVARASAICTHAHPTALASAIAAAAAVALTLEGTPPAALVDGLAGVLSRRRGVPGYEEVASHDPLGEQTQAFAKVREALSQPPERSFELLGGGWVGEEAVAGALYCFLRSPEDFRATVLVAANACQSDESARGHGRCDSDSIACIAGGIAGAYLGLSKIPPAWVALIEKREQLFDLAAELAAKAKARRRAKA